MTKTDSGWTLIRRRRWRVGIPDRPVHCLGEQPITIGGAADNTIVVDDPKVSRRHVEIRLEPGGVVVRDLGSKNGTYIDRVRVHEATLPFTGATLLVGDTRVAVVCDDEMVPIIPSDRDRCGKMLGQSTAMRAVFAQIEHVAPLDLAVLLHGETGTGKELAADAIHNASRRRDRPYVIVDVAAISRTLIESELFGHVRGAFTGATTDRAGAFERGNGGTIFIDEIGELEPEFQPRLLRVLETGQLKRIGGDRMFKVDVRVIAASNRDLAAEVAANRFRADLYYRLAVTEIDIPPLRERRADIPLLACHLAGELGVPPPSQTQLAAYASSGWPGNVRELRNAIARSLMPDSGEPPIPDVGDPPHAVTSDASWMARPYKEAKGEVVAEFTREYVTALLRRHDGNVSAAAREAKLDRDWVVELARRHGIPLRE